MKGRKRMDQVVVLALLEFEQDKVLIKEEGRMTRQEVSQRQPVILLIKRMTRSMRKLSFLKVARTFTTLTAQPR